MESPPAPAKELSSRLRLHLRGVHAPGRRALNGQPFIYAQREGLSSTASGTDAIDVARHRGGEPPVVWRGPVAWDRLSRMRTPGALVGLLVLAIPALPALPAAAAPPPTPTPAAPGSARPDPVIVVAAPGFPGTTAQAQPTMDRFAAARAAVSGRAATGLATSYFESETAGMAALARPAARYALVPLPFYLKHADEARLVPRLLVDEGGGSAQSWSLAAARGKVQDAAGLEGWEILGTPGYAPGFVRMALAEWGRLPPDTRVAPTAGILSALRRAASGESKVAVFLDRAQAAALPTLPFASSLDVVATSPALPSTLVCTVGTPGSGKAAGGADPVLEALLHLHESKDGAAALQAMRMVRFVPLDPGLMPPLRAAYAAATVKP